MDCTRKVTIPSRCTAVVVAALLMLGAACSGGGPEGGGPNAPGGPGNDPNAPGGGPGGPIGGMNLDDALGQRVVNYSLALRTAALKLAGRLPTMDEIDAVATATDPPTVYAQQVDEYLAAPQFAGQLLSYFRDQLRTGGSGRDTAATFAAMVVLQDRPYSDLFTANTGTCPTLNTGTGAFTAANCTNNPPQTAGLLTDPGVMGLWYGNLAFRRVRWVQESFVCRKFPTEFAATPVVMGNGQYTSPWPFASVPDMSTGGRINFRDTSSVVCANCHTTLNHIAPLFANFDMMGAYQGGIQVELPTSGTPTAQMSDWLVGGEVTSWRHGMPVADLGALGQAMAHDPDVLDCAVARVWNWAMSKTDIVTDASVVPDSVIAALTSDFMANGLKLKTTIRKAFLSDDFVRF